LHPSLNDDNRAFKLILYYTDTLHVYCTTLMKQILLKGKMEAATII